MVSDVIVGGELFTDYPITLANLPGRQTQNSNQQAPDATSFFPVVDAYRKAGLKDFSPKSQDAVHCRLLERGALPMIDRGDIRQAIDRCSNIWASLPGAGYGCSSSIWLTAWLQNSKKRAELVREIDVWAESPRLSPLWLSVLIVCLFAGC